jgi:hypothetical protein
MQKDEPAEKSAINEIVNIFFSIFNNTERMPDLSTIYSVCIPQTIIIKKTSSSEEIYTLETFIEPRKKMLTDGTLTVFEEHETKAETHITGNIAQRYSAYEKSGYLNGNFFKASGHKYFQFIRTTEGWKINSLIWEDEIAG